MNAHVEHYLNFVTSYTKVTYAKLRSDCRIRHIREARQCLAYLLRYNTQMTLSEIGNVLNRHYSTILHSTEVLNDEMKLYPNKYKWMERIPTLDYHNILPSKQLYICQRCGSESHHTTALHQWQTATDREAAGNA